MCRLYEPESTTSYFDGWIGIVYVVVVLWCVVQGLVCPE
jgi:hypothetical protein